MGWRADYHVHLEKGPYTAAWLDSFVETARCRGLEEFGLSEHLHDFYEGQAVYGAWWEREPNPADRRHAGRWWRGRPRAGLTDFVNLVHENEPEGLVLRLGIEADYIPGCEGPLGHLLRAFPWDYVLGSVHWLGAWGFDHLDRLHTWQGRDVDQVYRRYFTLLERAAHSGLFDVMAHPDVIKVAGHRPTFDPRPLYESAARAFAEAGVAVEVSTAGLRKPVGELYPAEAFLHCCQQRGVPITLASDAHQPDAVGEHIERAVDLARRCGYQEACAFVRRTRVMQAL